MQGTITINADKTGTHLVNNMLNMEYTDKVFVVHALGKLLGLSALDFQVMAFAEFDGVLDRAECTAVSIDAEELAKQLREDADES